MVNKKVMVLTAGFLGLGGLAALNETFASAEENTADITEEQTDVFDWMRERMGQGFHGFVNRDSENGDFQPGMGAFGQSARGHMGGGGMHGGRMHGAGNGFGPNAPEFQDEDWLEERDALRRDHFEAMHPEWDEEQWEEHDALREKRFENFDLDMSEEELEAWFEEHDELRRDHFETMHPEWDEESLEERESYREERRQNNRRESDDSAE